MPPWLDHIPSLSDDPVHPSQIVLRTYALALALSLGPSLIPFVTSPLLGKESSRTSLATLKHTLRRELGYDGFAFAIALSVGGGAALRHLWNKIDAFNTPPNPQQPVPRLITNGKRFSIPELNSAKGWLQKLGPEQRTFIANVVASSVGILLLQLGRERALRRARITRKIASPIAHEISPTLDLTLLLVVRASDSLLQIFLRKQFGQESGQLDKRHDSAVTPWLVHDLLEKEEMRRRSDLRQDLSSRLDGLLFWACSARIMWCFFYESYRLPTSYVKWINTLASVDPRLLRALAHLRDGKWGYTYCSPSHIDLLKDYAKELGHSEVWGIPTQVPAHGGEAANAIWKALGVTSRPGVGGIPCEVVHGNVGASLGLSHSCLANTGLRGLKAFVEAVAIYIPAHFLPVLMTRPRTLLRTHRFLETFLGALRSAAFLSTFVSSYWLAICFTRSLVLARLFPYISHDFWDGPFGCMLVGSVACGNSIWIEEGKRRGEMALYVMPKALRACLPYSWIKIGQRRTQIAERIAIILSISTLLTVAVHRPESLRGLSRWTLSFITNGPNAGFWKRKRRDPSIPPTPSFPPTPTNPSADQTPGLSRVPTPTATRYQITTMGP